MRLAPLPGPQTAFLACAADFALYGGAAGGGKTYALELDPLRYQRTAGFRGALFRMVYSDHFGPGGLYDEAREMWGPLGAEFVKSPQLRATFPSGSRIDFKYPDMRRWRKQVQGLQIAWAGFDEATHFPMSYILAVHGRLRTSTGIRTGIRMTCNPDPDHDLRQWVEPYLDSHGYPDRSLSGELRWFAADQDDGTLRWGGTREDAARAAGRSVDEAFSFAFFPAVAEDNTVLMAIDPNYSAKHSISGKVAEEQLGGGNWHVRDETAGMLRRARWEHIEPGDLPKLRTRVRAWDKAATKPQRGRPAPDFTATVLWGEDWNRRHWLVEADAMRDEPPEVDRFMRTTAVADGPAVTQHCPIDPGQAGKVDEAHIRKVLSHPRIGPLKFYTPTKAKAVRAQPLARALEAGRVGLVVGPWYSRRYKDALVDTTLGELFWAHVHGFPHVKEPGKPEPKDDFADVCADAFSACDSKPRYIGGLASVTRLRR